MESSPPENNMTAGAPDLRGERFWNAKHPSSYAKSLAEGSAVAGSETLSAEEKESERIMLEIRLPSGIQKASLKSAQINNLTEFLDGGELNQKAWSEDRIALTPKGRLVADRIVRKILF